jgi:hypothetical protein
MKTLLKFKKQMTKQNLQKVTGYVLRTVFKAVLRFAIGKLLVDALDIVVSVLEDDEDGPSNDGPRCTTAA